MLSPASLRVCCLAVMAPALTKADRRADCLPVVLPEPFYFSKTVDTFNSEDNNNHITFSTLNFKTAWQPSFNKSFMNKVWWRSGDRTKLLISNNIRYSAVEFRRHWALSSRLRLNVAPKCCKPWLYSKGFSTLADKLRLKYCTMNKNNLTNRSMGLAKANASLGLHDLKKMRKISQLRHKEDTTILESDGESSPDIRDSTNSDFQDETLVTVVSPVSKGILNKNHLSDHDCDVFSPSSSLDGLQSDSFSQTDSLRVIGENRPKECQLSNNSELELGSVVASSLQSNSVVSPAENNSGVDAFTVVVNNCSGPSSVESCDTSNKVLSVSVDLQQSSSVTEKPVENVNEQETILQLPSIFLEPQEKSPNPLLCNFVNEIPLLLDSPDFLLNASHSFENIGNTYLRLPNQLLDVINWEKSTQSRKKRQQMKSNQICCKLTLNENENFSKLISGREEKLKLAVVQFQLRKCKQLNLHVRKQMQHFVEHFQKKLGITCQMQVDPSHLRPEKDLVDIKTEILQSENVKSLSTAALVNLVRNIESNTIPDNLLPQQKTEMQNVDEPSDKSNVFDPEDFVEIKHTSKFLRNSMKKWLRSVDSDMTDESSDEESVHWVFQKMALDTHSSRQKKAIWKRLTESASLHSRSSWLIARIQELEYQLGMAKEKLKETVNLDGDVCFEESASCNSSALSATSIDIEQVSTKQTSLKKLIRPVNGYLDHSSVNDLSNVNCSLLESSVQLTSSLAKTEESCSRTRPLKMSFQKRKLISVETMPNLSSKVSKFSTVSCYCNSVNVIQPCVLCAGRYNSTQSVDPDTMPLQDRIALLDPIFHPVLSLEKEIPMGLHFENTLKLTEARYQTFQPVSPVEFRRIRFGNKTKHFSLLRNHSRKLNRYARSLLSVKYRNKHVQNSKHFRKHRLIFGKWRRLNRNKHSFHSRERIRRYSVVSSASSQDSPVPSPLSIFDDSSALDYMKKRRDDDQFDIDDVILPLNSKIGRAVERLQYKDITCPSWRREDKEGLDETEEIENISDAIFIQRHDRSEIEERKQLRSGPFGLNKRARRHRCDSRADSSGANTPDPVLLYNQDILFQMPTSSGTRPSSPALSPPNTPSSIAVISDDSQPSLGNGSVPSGFEKRKLSSQKRSLDENFPSRSASIEYDEVQPYAKRVYPLPDEEYELAVLASVHAQQEDADSPFSEPSCPASPESFTCSSSTSTVEEENDDDIADPEWTVHKNDPNSLVLKLSKR